MQQAGDEKITGVAVFWEAGSTNALFSSIDRVCPTPRAKSRRSSDLKPTVSVYVVALFSGC